MSFKIIGDSCCDYPYLAPDYPWLCRVPLTITLEGREYVDNKSLRPSLLISDMAASREAPKSACPSPGVYIDAMDCGCDDVYVVTLSHKLSGSFQSAAIAMSTLKSAEPDRHIFVFSSNSASAGELAVCEKIYALASSGMVFEDVVSETLRFIASLSTFFVLETLDVFRKNGRLNHLQAAVTGALRLKLIMGGDENGSICLRGKALSMGKALLTMGDLIARRCGDTDMSGRTLYITHCACPDRARKAAEIIMGKVGFKDFRLFTAGGISTIYANSGGLIVAY